jgi:hypothetical protein
MRNDFFSHGVHYVGHRLASALDFLDEGCRTVRDNYIIGDPQDCEIGTAAQLKKKGFVGLYRRLVKSHETSLDNSYTRSRWVE